MNIKNKIIAVLLMSITVCVGAGYYLYTKCTNSKATQPLQIGVMELYNYEIIPNPFDNFKEGKRKSIVGNPVKKKSKHNYDYSADPSSQLPSAGGDFDLNILLSNSFKQSSPQSNGTLYGTNYISSNKENGIYASKNYSGGAFAYTSRTRRSITDGSSERGGGYYSGISGPMAVPFSNNGVPVTSPGTILFDPGVEKDIEQPSIPVGEGWWILLLMASAYVGIKKYETI